MSDRSNAEELVLSAGDAAASGNYGRATALALIVLASVLIDDHQFADERTP